jgi:IS5 family transposase
MEEALCEATILSQFLGLYLDRTPDETMILNFRRLGSFTPFLTPSPL